MSLKDIGRNGIKMQAVLMELKMGKSYWKMSKTKNLE